MKRNANMKPPPWALWLFPNARGIETNPLYLRVTGQGYAPEGAISWRRFWIPPELAAFEFCMVRQFGLLPFALIASPLLFMASPPSHWPAWGRAALLALQGLTELAYALGVIALFSRSTDIDGSVMIRNVARRGARLPWSEALHLTAMPPIELERALCAGLWQRETLSLAFRFMMFVVAFAPVCWVYAFLFRQLAPAGWISLPPPNGALLGKMFLVGAPLLLAAWLEITLLSALKLASAMRGADVGADGADVGGASAIAGARLGARTALAYLSGLAFSGALFAAAHVVGLGVYVAWTALRMRTGIRVEAFEFGLSDLAGAFMFTLPNMPVGFALARATLRRREGGLARSLMASLARD